VRVQWAEKAFSAACVVAKVNLTSDKREIKLVRCNKHLRIVLTYYFHRSLPEEVKYVAKHSNGYGPKLKQPIALTAMEASKPRSITRICIALFLHKISLPLLISFAIIILAIVRR
jgi:hypothetical protein